MQEYEIYIPTSQNDGRPVAETEIRWIKQTLTKAFGGHTQLTHPSKGASRLGGVTFHDEITILRVLDDGTSHFNMAEFKASLEDRLQQHTVLIVARAVTLIE